MGRSRPAHSISSRRTRETVHVAPVNAKCHSDVYSRPSPAAPQEVRPLLSYMDPGSGSLLAQIAVAGAAGAAVAVKMGWRRTTALLDGKRRRRPAEAADQDARPGR
jgi:hypothetical protein